MTNRLLTARELQEFLKIDRITVYRMVESGDLPGIKVGGQWRFSQDTVDAWLQARVSTAAPHGVPAVTQARFAQALPPTEALFIASRPLESLQVCDLVAPSCLEIIQGSFAQALNVAVGITNLAGEPLVPMSNPCTFCQIGWDSTEFKSRCQRSWSAFCDGTDQEVRLRVCHAGINYAVAPVLVHGQRLGLVASGQFLETAPDDVLLGKLRELARDCGLNEDQFVSESKSIRLVDADRMQLVTKLLVTIASALSEIATQNYHVRQKLAQIAQIVKTP